MDAMNRRMGKVVGTMVLLVGILAGSLTATTAQTPAEPEAVREAERARVGALVDADMEVAGTLHADDFQHINPEGVSLAKEQLLGAVGSGVLDFVAWDIGEIEVRHYEDVAAIRYVADLETIFQGQAVPPHRHWFTVLYELRDGTWQAVWSHTTYVAEAAGTPMVGTPAA